MAKGDISRKGRKRVEGFVVYVEISGNGKLTSDGIKNTLVTVHGHDKDIRFMEVESLGEIKFTEEGV